MKKKQKEKKSPWKTEIPYLTAGEKSIFKGMVARGEVSFFRTAACQGEDCEEDIPPFKKYCSKACYQEAEGVTDNDEVESEDDEW